MADFSAAVKKGEVTVALVDAAYLAVAGGNYTVLAAAVRGGDTSHGWQLVARGADKLAASRASACSCPASAVARPTSCSTSSSAARSRSDLLREDRDRARHACRRSRRSVSARPMRRSCRWASSCPAVRSAVARASGAVRAGARRATGSCRRSDRETIAAAALAFKGDATVGGLPRADADAVKAVARRFTVPAKRGPLAVPAIRLLVGDLVEGRTFAIERTPVTAFAAKPR